MDKLSYALGLGIGQQLAQMGAHEVVAADFAAAIEDVLKGNALKLKHQEAQQIVTQYFQQQESRLEQQRRQQASVHKEAGEKYLAENMRVVDATTGEPVDNLFDVSGATEYAKLEIDDEPKTAETLKTERRRSRSQWKRIRLNDGREFTSTNGILGLFKQLGIKDEYAGFFDGNKERDLRKEAENLSHVIEKRLCLVVTEYYTYNFDGVLENFILQEKI
jgi:hypothetical protein